MIQEGREPHHDSPAAHSGDTTGISDDVLRGEVVDAAKSILGDQDPTRIDPFEARLNEILDSNVDINALSPTLAERFKNLTPEQQLKAFVAFGHEAVSTEAALVETKAELDRANLSHGQQLTAIRLRHEKSVKQLKQEARTTEAALEKKATTDPLTGLLNRAGLIDRLDGLRQHGGRQRSSALFVDLDRFKPVNDEHGHGVGNSVLVRVADVLQSHARDTDIVARIGGDEFAVVFVGTDVEEAERLAETLGEDLKGDYVSTTSEGIKLDISASIGLSPFDNTINDADEALLAADRAMYTAKSKGRGQIVRVDLAHPDHVEPLH